MKTTLYFKTMTCATILLFGQAILHQSISCSNIHLDNESIFYEITIHLSKPGKVKVYLDRTNTSNPRDRLVQGASNTPLKQIYNRIII